MHYALCTIFCLFAATLVFLSYKSLRGGIEYLSFFKRQLSKPEPTFTPFVSIIAPCRGMDEDLEENLEALFRQNFPRYEIIFAVDDEKDEAVPVINKLIGAYSFPPSKLIIAGKADSEAQKIHNLREAVLQVSDKSKIFVFVDSDARPSANWSRNLIAPLQNETIGAATGYRWFISKKVSFASELRSAWNASIASALGANLKSNFCWGGSMAIHRETFEKLGLREKWKGTLSDDFTVTRLMKEAGLSIFFVPQALTATIESCSIRELLEFTTRQMKITRVYAANLWLASFLGSFLFNLVVIGGICIAVFSTVNSFMFWFALISVFLIFAFSAGKAYLRLRAVQLALKNHEKALKKQLFWQNTLWVITPALFFYNSLCALFSRKIVWRGITYKLASPHTTEILKTEL